MKASAIKQPALPLLEVWVESSAGSMYLTGDKYRPQYIVRMTFNRNADNRGNNVIFDLVDRNWSELEAILIEGKDKTSTNLRFRYGWSEIAGKISPIYKLKIAGWTSVIQPYGTNITLEGISEICVNGGLNEGKAKVWKEPEIHKIVAEIGKKYGYKLDVEPCEPIKIIGNNTETTEKEGIRLEQGNMSDLNFIADVLTKYAKSTKGEGDYICRIDDENKTLIFKPRAMLSDVPKADYVYYATRDSDVIEWSAEVTSDIMKGIIGSGGTMGSVVIDNTTGKQVNQKLSNQEGTENKILSGGSQVPVTSTTFDEASTEIRTVLPSAPSISIPKAWNVNTYMKLFNLGGYKATMKILGDPRIIPGEMIRVNVYDGNGALHYTSGKYKISSVTDVIDSGFFYTELSLDKPSGKSGEETGKGRQSG